MMGHGMVDLQCAVQHPLCSPRKVSLVAGSWDITEMLRAMTFNYDIITMPSDRWISETWERWMAREDTLHPVITPTNCNSPWFMSKYGGNCWSATHSRWPKGQNNLTLCNSTSSWTRTLNYNLSRSDVEYYACCKFNSWYHGGSVSFWPCSPDSN